MAKSNYAEGRKKHLAKYAIEKGLTEGDLSVWEEHFGRDDLGMPKKPRNGEFIIKIVEILKSKL